MSDYVTDWGDGRIIDAPENAPEQAPGWCWVRWENGLVTEERLDQLKVRQA